MIFLLFPRTIQGEKKGEEEEKKGGGPGTPQRRGGGHKRPWECFFLFDCGARAKGRRERGGHSGRGTRDGKEAGFTFPHPSGAQTRKKKEKKGEKAHALPKFWREKKKGERRKKFPAIDRVE